MKSAYILVIVENLNLTSLLNFILTYISQQHALLIRISQNNPVLIYYLKISFQSIAIYILSNFIEKN